MPWIKTGVLIAALVATAPTLRANHIKPLEPCGVRRTDLPPLSVPVRWCVVGNPADPTQGAPAFTNPSLAEPPPPGAAPPRTEDILWHRHERASDLIYIPQANITFRSGLADPKLITGQRFPVIPDPLFLPVAPGSPCRPETGCYGDVIRDDDDVEGKELVRLCQEAWNKILPANMTDTGLMAINVRQILGRLDSSGRELAEYGFAFVGKKQLIVTDNAFSVVDSLVPNDKRDRFFAHEAGHAFPAGLTHTGPEVCPRAPDNARQNLMRPIGLQFDDRDQVDPDHDEHMDVCLLARAPGVAQEPFCQDRPAVDQVSAVRGSMNNVFGAARIDLGNVFPTGRGTVVTDPVRDVAVRALDMSMVYFTEPNTEDKTILRQDLFGAFKEDSFISPALEYYWMLDLDGSAATGGAPSALGLPTQFKGAEIVARVEVRRGPIVEVASAAPPPLFLTARATVWRFQGSAFAEVTDPGIRASVASTTIVADRIDGTAVETSQPDMVVLELPNSVRGPRAEPFRMQALTRGGASGREVVDKFDDPAGGEPGKDVHMTPPTYPLCTVVPNPGLFDDTLAVSVTGLIPDRGLHVLVGPNEVARGRTDVNGNAEIAFGVPFTAHDGMNLVTVGNDNTAVTADCLVDIVFPAECLADTTPPTFDFVPPAKTISSCGKPDLGQARARDACGVRVTNDAPLVFALGTTTVTWTARDRAGNVARATQSVTAVLGDDRSCCPVGTHVIEGTAADDILVGTAGADCILGKGGNDTIVGLAGNDFISGGAGDDILRGDEGNDTIYGGPGRDQLSGMSGNDTLRGGDNDDQLNGGEGDDRLFGDSGNDQLNGESGNDLLDGGSGTDICQPGGGSDQRVSCER
jgi:hypothetical protein